MRFLVQLIVLCLAMLTYGTADAELTAEKLIDSCSSKNEVLGVSCVAYISGFRDGHLFGMTIAANKILGSAELDKHTSFEEDYQRFSVFCLPSAVKNGQIQKVFVKYMSEHPEELHLRADLALVRSLVRYFPCKQEPKGSDQ